MTRREQRVINAFINCIKSGTYSVDYAITLIEDNQRYGWLSNEAKDHFYEVIDEMFPEEPTEEIEAEEVEPKGEE